MAESFIAEGQEKAFDQKMTKKIDDVKQLIYDTMIDFHNFEFPKYIANYKKYLGFVGDRLQSIESWQSNVDYPLVASVVDTMFGNIFDFGYEFGINEPKLKKLCTQAFDFRGIGKGVFKEAAKEILICGKAYVKDYLLKETHTDTFFGETIEQVIKKPSMHYISIFDVLYDRSKGLTESPFKVIRTFATGEAIKKKILPLILAEVTDAEKKIKEKQFDRLIEAYKDSLGTRFSMFDYNPVKSLTLTTQFYNSDNRYTFTLPQCSSKEDILAGFTVDGQDGTSESKKNYFLNAKKSTFELVEYITSDEKIIFLNGNLIYIGDKKYNLGEIREANFSLVPGTGNANGVADNLGGLQDINNMLWNAFLDNIKLVLGPMFKISGNIAIGKNGTLDFKKFRAFRSNGSSDIEKIQLGVTDFAPINFMQGVEAFSDKRSGVNNYIMGGSGSIERVAGGIDMKFNQYKSKLTPITDSIDQMMGNIARSWILMYLKYFTIEELKKLGVEVKKVFEKNDKGIDKFSGFTINDIDLVTIIDETNITFTYNSLNKLTKENSRAAIKETFPALIQYAAEQVNMSEIIKVLAGQDFDPDNIIVKKEPAVGGAFQPKQTFGARQTMQLPGGGAPAEAGGSPVPTEAPDDEGYDDRGNQYDPNKYDESYGDSNNMQSSTSSMSDQDLLDQLGSL